MDAGGRPGEGRRAARSTKARGERGQQHFNPTHNLASPSPVTDGQLVVVHFGNGDLAAYDFEGKRLWRRNLQEDFGQFTIWWGHANSPLLYQDLVISVCMQDNCSDLDEFKDKPAPSYLVAHDTRTGQLRWKTPRPTPARAEACDSYTTPLLWKHGNGLEMIVMGGQILDGYDPATGKRLWYLPGLSGNRVITGPVVAGDMAYFTQGMRQPLLAVKLGGRGQLPKSDVLWEFGRGTPDSPTPVVWGDLLFLVTNNGIAKCLSADDRPAALGTAAEGGPPRVAAGRRRADLLPQRQGPGDRRGCVAAFREARRKPTRRSDHRLAHRLGWKDLHPRAEVVVLHRKVRLSLAQAFTPGIARSQDTVIPAPSGAG